jgi:ParB family chromosome partitioning protein
LEALLGQLPVRNETALPAQTAHPPAADAAVLAVQPAPSAEAMFWLDAGHATPGQATAVPHHLPAQPAAAAEAAAPGTVGSRLSPAANRVSVKLIDSNPSQPRQEFEPEEMRSLAESLTAHGLLQPLVVRKLGERYQLVAGERRLRAAVQAGWTDVPVTVVEADDRQMAELAIVENLQRKDLSPLEKAASFQKYLDQYGGTQEELAGRLKVDRSTIANLIRLLELPAAVQDAIRRKQITSGHARALLPLGDEREQIEFCQRIQREGLNVRQTEGMVQEMIDKADRDPLAAEPAATASKPARASRTKNEHLAALEQEFRSALGLRVALRHNARGRGRLVIQFRNHEEFDRLKKQICGG